MDPSAELYAADRLPRFDIELPQASLDALNALSGDQDPARDEYVHATFRYGDEVVTDVGLRIKGEASFRTLDGKPAFKIKFDEFVAHQSFRGLRRLTLNNAVEDPSFLAERLAYHVFRSAALPAPRCNNARVFVNGEFFGVYANVEAEDKSFLTRWFTRSGGNLFEESGFDFLPGNEPLFELETNESANDKSGLSQLIAAAAEADETNFSEVVGTKLNLEQFLRFSAAEAAVNQWDMYSYTRFYPNNFRVYEDPSDGRFVFLPWGMDMSMKSFGELGRAYIPVFELGHNADDPDEKVSSGTLFRECLAEPPCKAAYAAEVERIATLYEQLELDQLAATFHDQISEYVYADQRKEYSSELFEKGYGWVARTIEGRVRAMRADLKSLKRE